MKNPISFFSANAVKILLLVIMALCIGQGLYANTTTVTHTVTVTITATYNIGTPTLTPTPSLKELVSDAEVSAWKKILYPSKVKALKNIKAFNIATPVSDDEIRIIILSKPVETVVAVKTAIVTKVTPTPTPVKIIDVEVKPK